MYHATATRLPMCLLLLIGTLASTYDFAGYYLIICNTGHAITVAVMIAPATHASMAIRIYSFMCLVNTAIPATYTEN